MISDSNHLSLLQEWYQLDTNTCPPERVLQVRKSAMTEIQKSQPIVSSKFVLRLRHWTNIEPMLNNFFRIISYETYVVIRTVICYRFK